MTAEAHVSAHLLHRDIKSVHTKFILSVANGEEVSSVRPEAGALGFIQQALKTGTMDNVSKRLWISKNPVQTCLLVLEKEMGLLFRRVFYVSVLISKASALCYLRVTLRHPAAFRGTALVRLCTLRPE